MKNKVIILGGGPVGLISAWLFSKRKWDVELYEKNTLVGGMCRSWKWSDFIVDTGPHIFHTPDKNMWNFWQKNFGELLVEGDFWAKNTFDDDFQNLYDYPLSIEGIKKFQPYLKKKIFSEIQKLKIKKSNSTNFEEHVIAQVGPTLTKMFFKNYPAKVWGIDTKKMTAEWAPKRVKFRKKSLPFYHGEWSAVGKYGTGSVYNKIKSMAVKNGVKINLKHTLTNINHENNIIKSLEFGDKKKINVDENTQIISSLPLNLTVRLLGHKSNLKFRGVRTIYIAIKKQRVLPKNCNWLYYSSKNIIFNRISEHKSMTKFIAPKNKTYLSAEITYSKHDKVDKTPFAKIKKKIKDDLLKVGLISNYSDIYDISENKEDFVYPVQFTDYKYELSNNLTKISKFNQLYSLGTGGEFNYSDSQIIFHKTIDLVNTLCDKYSNQIKMLRNSKNFQLNNQVKLGNKIVGDNNKPFIIAEAGLNHNGDIAIAKKLIDEAKRVGCDAIKFQTYKSDNRVSNEVKSAKYAEEADGLQENIYQMFKRLEMSKKDHVEIFRYARRKKIEIFSTPFDENSVDFLEKLKVKFYKIASIDLVNLPLIKKIGFTGKPLILSTGMSNLSNVEDAIDTFKSTGNKNLILLHCLSSYPANENEMNLNAIKTLKNNFNIPVGLSDHFPGVEISLLSLGLGANIIERHFTLDKTFEGPDHILSSEPEEMKKLVDISKNVISIFGDGQKRIQPSEFNVIYSQRKSVYAKRNIKSGEKLTKNNLVVKGPGGGILPKFIDIIMNKKTNKKIKKDHPITWNDL